MKPVMATVLLAASLCAQSPPDPRKEGPYPVGVTTTVVVDTNRTDHLTGKARTLLTEIWYPADDQARTLPPNRYRDFFPGGFTPEVTALLAGTYRNSPEEVEKMFWNKAVRDAPVRAGRYPVVIFSHGNGGTRIQNTFWCDHLASHGFIIVSADHTGNARFTILDGELIRGQGSERQHSAQDRPKDMSRLLDEMIQWDRGADRRFAGRIDTAHAAATGMSFGSYSAIVAADMDPRFKVVIGMAAAPAAHTNLNVPSQYWLARRDKTLGEVGNALISRNYEMHTGPAMLIELVNGGHYSFTDMFKLLKRFGDGVGDDFTPMATTYEIINSYGTAFLGAHLKGQKEYQEFLGSNPWPGELLVQHKGP